MTNGQQDIITGCVEHQHSNALEFPGESGGVCRKMGSGWRWSGPPVVGVIKYELKDKYL